MIKFYLIGILCFVMSLAQAQKATITGKVSDSMSAALPSATVMLLNASDSSLVNFAVTNGDGSFDLKRVDDGNYQLKVTFVGFRPATKRIEINSESVDIGLLIMQPQTKELDEVVIEGEKAPVTVKQDTIEFDAGSFRTKPNANVEDLLKKLPGMEVENDGTVKA